MAHWYEEDFSEDVVYEFFRQCKEFTKRSIEISGIKDFAHTNFNFFEPDSQHTFSPMGIVVSSSKTTSIWDTLLAIASRSYNTHFIIANRKPRKGDGDLIEDLPATILIPSTTEHVVHHASYMSPYTWGIELRNLGRLRPCNSDKPMPVYNGEETDKIFLGANEDSKYYWWNNLWRQEFEGRVSKYGNFAYEHPMTRQIETMLILMKILSKVSSLKKELIVPLDCVVGGTPVLPTVKWYDVRSMLFGNHNDKVIAERNLFTGIETFISDWNAKESRDEYFLRELNMLHKSRHGFDSGFADFVLNGPEYECSIKKEDLKIVARELGYDWTNLSLAFRMFTISQGGRAEAGSMHTTMAKKILYQRKGVDVEDFSDM